jgi:alkanesulfonate monooxygenase SsuD/methylene tetrahydromethanopterin reductase-like flavin-dependent oxidoreductase (luciferase family)
MQQRSLRQRTGFNIRRSRPSEAVALIQEAEDAGVEQIWMTMGAAATDTLTVFAAAAARTERVRLGTSIIPAFTRHPLGLATQALALHDLAPGRVRIGIGTSHGPTMTSYGMGPEHPIQQHPLEWLREYLTVARSAIQQGAVSFSGQSFNVQATLSGAGPVPVLISALRLNAWELAGELSDGGISWLCPADFLVDEALPALRRGAARTGRSAPPLVAHVLVAFGTDRSAIRARMRAQIGGYTRLPFYAKMFAAAGYPLGPDGAYTDDLLDHLVVAGDDAAIAAQLAALLDRGIDELLVMLVHGDDQPAEERHLMRIIAE